jgi:hypothetical protein
VDFLSAAPTCRSQFDFTCLTERGGREDQSVRATMVATPAGRRFDWWAGRPTRELMGWRKSREKAASATQAGKIGQRNQASSKAYMPSLYDAHPRPLAFICAPGQLFEA